MGDYFQHWLDMGKKLTNPPKIFNVNWFQTNDKGEFMWPGFGDNLRALLWALGRCKGEKEAVKSPIGYLPRPEDIDISGLDGFSTDDLKALLKVDKALWEEEIKDIGEFLKKFDRLPAGIKDQYDALAARIMQ